MENMPSGGGGMENSMENMSSGGVWRTVWRICLLGGYGEQYGEYAFWGGYGEQYGEYAF